MSGNWTVSHYTGEFSSDTRQNLRNLYSGHCAVCGQRRESPFGHLEAEAAHIHPAQHGGPDTEANGLLLCRQCHWGFDSGWLSLTDDARIIVSNDDAADGHEYFQQFSNDSIEAPSVNDLEPLPRFTQVHRKLSGFDPINAGDRLTIGGLRSGKVQLIDGRQVIVEGSTDEALVVNCEVTSVDSQAVRCSHHTILEQRVKTDSGRAESPFKLDPVDYSFDKLEEYVREIKRDYSGVAQKWEWGRLFRNGRTKYGLSHKEIADTIDVEGASELQVQRAERVYEMFPDRGYEGNDIPFSAIAELQRIFPNTEDARAAYDCIAATGTSLTTMETRAWVELLLSESEVTRETARESVEEHVPKSNVGLSERVSRILAVHDEYLSVFTPN
ncbi:HNH endonuclease [Haloferax marisrubri]|uniref:HNH endonuclease n=1 Tax=Haloferax marisrubri TaxID=1544719 RepID=A0A2P4NQ31_9EURY|nr:HNH endonuclease [Haloferax marisrubri]POG55241.1 HNH endonuclease [Haloferax marisrubri]